MKNILPDDGCFAFLKRNHGDPLDFTVVSGKVYAAFIPQKIHQGFKDIMHGDIITPVLDDAMVRAVFALGIGAPTVEISVRFKRPLAVGDHSQALQLRTK